VRRTGTLIAALAIDAIGGAVLLAAALDRDLLDAPRASCVVVRRRYEDGSASLYCRGQDIPFGAIDAETGRLRVSAQR
jgi:hypothetical protein